MRWSLLLIVATKLAAGQLNLLGDTSLAGGAMANMPQVTSLDVECERSGMTVNIEFSLPFDGVIFSKGHFSNPACRYVRTGSGQNAYTFVIPMKGCGTRTIDDKTDDGGTMGFQNMIMVQHEEFVQEMWDTAQKLTCRWPARMKKLITFRPFAVDMLQSNEVRVSGDDIMCWMDIKLGKGPFADPVDGIVQIGDEMTVVIYTKDGGSEFDMLVKNCYAYDAEDIEGSSTTKLRLTDDLGCVIKSKLMGPFTLTRDTGSSGADLIAHAPLFAFKFPDKMDVYLSCEIELCKGGCTNTCGSENRDNSVTADPPIRTSTTTLPPPVDPCLRNPGSRLCCSRNPGNPACTTTTSTTTTTTTTRPDPCVLNPGSRLCCLRNPFNPACTTTTSTTTTTTTTRPDPCVLNPGSRLCCLRNPFNPACTTTTSTTTSTTTTRPDPCILNPGSTLCCLRNPSNPGCSTTPATTTTTEETTTTPPTTTTWETTTTPRTTTTTQRPDPCLRSPGSRQCCIRSPNNPACTTTTTARPDFCTLSPGSLLCCARDPGHPSCPRTTTTTTTERIDPCTSNPGSSSCCASNSNHPSCTTTTTTTTTTRPDPCQLNPGSPQCCARNPRNPACTTTTSTTTPRTTTTRTTTTRRPDPCDTDPGSSRCCSKTPRHPSCPTSEPCSGPDDPRPKCRPTTTPASTTPDLRYHAFHNFRNPGPTRRRRPTYGTRLSPEVLAALRNKSRRRRGVALPPPPPPPPPGVASTPPPPPPPSKISTAKKTLSMVRGFRVVGANDLTFKAVAAHQVAPVANQVCMPTATFAVGLLMLSLLLITAVFVATFTWLRLKGQTPNKKTVEAKNPYYK